MIFYSDYDKVLWGKNEKALCRFKNKKCDVKDEKIIKELIDLGYKHEEVKVEETKRVIDEKVENIYLENKTNAELKTLLDEKGIEYDKRANKATLLKLLGV